MSILMQHRHLLIQESKLDSIIVFVQLRRWDKFVQTSVNIHSTNVKFVECANAKLCPGT